MNPSNWFLLAAKYKKSSMIQKENIKIKKYKIIISSSDVF